MSNHTVIVTGSRDWNDRTFVENRLTNACPTEVVQGGAGGADSIAREWAKYHGIPCETFWANWNKYGRKAGPIRNRRMLEAYKHNPNVTVIAFRQKMSPGTTNCIETAYELGMNVIIYDR